MFVDSLFSIWIPIPEGSQIIFRSVLNWSKLFTMHYIVNVFLMEIHHLVDCSR